MVTNQELTTTVQYAVRRAIQDLFNLFFSHKAKKKDTKNSNMHFTLTSSHISGPWTVSVECPDTFTHTFSKPLTVSAMIHYILFTLKKILWIRTSHFLNYSGFFFHPAENAPTGQLSVACTLLFIRESFLRCIAMQTWTILHRFRNLKKVLQRGPSTNMKYQQRAVTNEMG